MAFVVEDGTIVAGATSYITRAQADSYHDDRGNSAWADASDKDQEAALIRATDYLDREFRYIGDETDANNQTLRWPRANACRPNGVVIENDEIPTEIIEATAELALSALTGDLDPDGRDVVNQVSKRAGGVSVSQSRVGNRPTFHKAQSILFDLLAERGLKRA